MLAAVISHDLGLVGRKNSLLSARISLIGLVIAAVFVSIYLPDRIFDRVVFAWVALGSAFGPLVFVRLAGFPEAAKGIFVSNFVRFCMRHGLFFGPQNSIHLSSGPGLYFWLFLCFYNQKKKRKRLEASGIKDFQILRTA